MPNNLNPIVNASEVLKARPSKDFILIEAGADAKPYLQKHITGAFYIDLEKDLADVSDNPSKGGRHPLPTLAKFASLLGNLGIKPESHVVIYDRNKGTNASARFWWMLLAIGHQKTQVVNGGFQALVDVGFSLSTETEIPKKTNSYPFSKWLLPQVNLKQVIAASQNHNFLIIDVRAKPRYDGLEEPLDLIAGHIPSAINIPLTENLDPNGFFLTPSALVEKYRNVFKNRPASQVIIHCGSGVTACHTLLSIASAGLDIPNLYVGSWSEWSRNNLPMVLAE